MKNRKKWGKQTVDMGDFLYWLTVKGYWIRGVDGINRTEEMKCMKCDSPHKPCQGWGWLQTTMCMHVCDEQIKHDIPPKTSDEWDAWGR